jgi:hypothetical protein
MSDTAYRTVDPDDEPDAISRTRGADDEAYPRDLDEQHKQLVRWFEESELARQDEIRLAERDREYYDHSQWTKEEMDALKARGQPPVVIIKIHD